MFFDFPILNGMYLYYQEYYVLVFLIRGTLTSLIFYLIATCLLGDLMKTNRKYKLIDVQERLIEMQYESVKSAAYIADSHQYQNIPTQNKADQKSLNIKSSNNMCKILKYVLGIISLIFSAITLSWGLTAITAFRYLPPFYSIVSNLVIYSWTFIYLVYIVSPEKRMTEENIFVIFQEFIRRQQILFYLIAVVIFVGSLIFPLISHGTCVCDFQDGNETLKLFDWDPFNTKVMRYMNVPQSCPTPSEICFVYPTLPPDATSSVFINVHTHTSADLPLNLTYWSEGTKSKISHSTVFLFDDFDERANRNIHTFVLSDLEQNTFYSFQVSIKGILSQVYRYKTLPLKLINNQSINIVNGGDIGNSNNSIQIWKSLAQVNPDIIFIGGDISYDNNLIDCVWTMDYLLGHYQDLTISVGRLIPLVLAIGNHDIGLNAGAQREVVLLDGKAKPMYFSFFPQHYEVGRVDRQVPLVSNRLSYFYHTFADILFFTLDTEYAASMESQAIWMDSVIENIERPVIKMAHYHNPIFWACFGHREDATVFENGILYWAPRFNIYNFSTNFENHAHEQKRTKLLKGSVEGKNGTLYLGDGSWGATLAPCQGVTSPDYIDNYQLIGGVWITTITNKQLTHQAFTAYGEITDSTFQLTIPYFY